MRSWPIIIVGAHRSELIARNRSPVNSGAAREQGRAILNASFLVAPARVVDFQRALTAMVNKYEPSGFKFDFTGPWPPYHFVGERGE